MRRKWENLGIILGIILKHQFKINENRINWVQVPGKYLHKLVSLGKVYLQWRIYKIKEYVNVTRCFKCHRFGHIARVCSEQEQICETCGNKGHIKKDCTKKDSQQCINCVRVKRKEFNKHDTRSKDCPEYKKQIELYHSRVKWD